MCTKSLGKGWLTHSSRSAVPPPVPITTAAEQISAPKPPNHTAFSFPSVFIPKSSPLWSLRCQRSHSTSPPVPKSCAKVFSTAKPPAHRRGFSPPFCWVWGFGSFPPGILPRGFSDKNPFQPPPVPPGQGDLRLHGQLLEGAVVIHRAPRRCTALIQTLWIKISAL